MKIVHCIFSMETGGAEVMAVGLLNELCSRHSVSLIIINNKWNTSLVEQLDKRVTLFCINREPGSRNPIPIFKLNTLLWRLKPDVIHSHDPNIAKVVKIRNAKWINTIHDIGIPAAHYKRFDELVAISEAVYQDVAGKSDRHMTTIHNGIPVQQFKRRQNFSLPQGETLRLVQISRLLHAKKGQDVLLHALKKLRYQYEFVNFKIDFIGTGDSHDYLKNLAVKLGIQDNVCFKGEQSRQWLYDNLCGYHILVQPSRYEGFGLTVIEGCAAGLPVLVSNIDGPAEIVATLPSGFLFRTENNADCAKILHHIIDLYQNDAVSQLVSETFPLIEKYSLTACANAYIKEYSQLLAS